MEKEPIMSENKPESSFNPDKEITDKDWEDMTRDLERERHMVPFFTRLAMQMKLLNPRITIDLKETEWKEMKNALEEAKEDLLQTESQMISSEGYNPDHIVTYWNIFTSQAVAMKVLDSEANLDLDQAPWNNIIGQLKREKQEGLKYHEWSEFVRSAANIKILNPKAELGLDEVVWQGIKNELEKCRQGNDWKKFSAMASNARIIEPNQDINLDDAAWQGMRGLLEESRRKDVWPEVSFSSQAVHMKILAAEKVEVTNNGLEIRMPKQNK